MKTKYLIFLLTLVSVITVFYFYQHADIQVAHQPLHAKNPMEVKPRIQWELKRLRDPETGRIPAGIRAKELAFAQTLPNDDVSFAKNSGINALDWIARGPFNVGGRTRALALDVTDENIILAGSVSGGLWRSTNAGQSWNKVISSIQYQGITCLSQDIRPGKTSTWYAGTGEGTGNSASGNWASYLGNGLYKSTDGGLSWISVSSTATNIPQTFDSYWDMVWNVATDPSATDDRVYAACYGVLYKSVNGGSTWTIVRGVDASPWSYYTDVKVTSTGIVYCVFSSDGPHKGIWRSTDGITWANITSSNWPSEYERIIIAIDPNNENDVFFLGVTPNTGKMTTNFYGESEWNSLWKYSYLSGDGTGLGGTWEDRSANLPDDSSQFNNFNVQGGYDLLVKVKPGNSNIIFIGGTNLYRSNDAFTTPNNTVQLGGYEVNTTLPNYEVYPEHHPDQHNLAFIPSDPTKMFSATDGGIFYTTDNNATRVVWTSKNVSYRTTQFYTIALDHSNTSSNVIVGGLQDNGSWFTNSADPQTPWTMPSKGDGSFCSVNNNGTVYYFSQQQGKLAKFRLDSNGTPIAYVRIDPIGIKKDEYLFINPFIVDLNNENIMYLAGGKKIWRNDSLSQIPFSNTWDSISTGWTPFADTIPLAGAEQITALAISTQPANILYYGTSTKKVFRVDSANIGSPNHKDITYASFPISGYVNCIAVDPLDANKVFVVFSNYSVYSLYYSINGGITWQKIGGNLEGTSLGAPSLRWISIAHKGRKTFYFVSASTGLYATDTLKGLTTVWVQQGSNSIGNMVCEMTDYRESDGLLVVATHGNGVYSTYITENSVVTENNLRFKSVGLKLESYPNPMNDMVTVKYDLPEQGNIKISLTDQNGRIVKTIFEGKETTGSHSQKFNCEKFKPGVYYITLETGTQKKSVGVVKM